MAGAQVKREVRVLIIEDKEADWKPLVDEAEHFDAEIEFVVAPTALEAMSAMEGDNFDVVVCDLKIPSAPGRLDADAEHGRAVFQTLQEVQPGTPVIVFSGHATPSMIGDFVNVARKVDVLGQHNDMSMVQFFTKVQLAQCVAALRDLTEGFYRLEEIVVSTGIYDVALTPDELRVLRIFASRRGGSMIDVEPLGGGLSDAKALRVAVMDLKGTRKALVAAKLSLIDRVRREASRYDQVSSLIPPGAGAPLVGNVQDGAAGMGGLFFRMADDHTALFGLLRTDEQAAIGALQDLRTKLNEWHADAPADQQPVATIRRLLLSDDEFARISQEEGRPRWAAADAQTVPMRPCVQHGDLHGFNALVDAQGSTVLIDYGEVIDATASLDPVTIELSAIFHPDSSDLMGGWPTVAQTGSWTHLDTYVEDCPFPQFVRACREWAHTVAASDLEVYACGFAYAVRQLKYENALGPIAVGVADATSTALL
jgi:CheY-like chemotaxis protein